MLNYLRNHTTYTDISEHLPTLRILLSQCRHAVEFGVRTGVSTSAFLTVNIPTLHYDIAPAPDIFFPPHEFIQASSLDIKIPNTDLLFIDSDHSYVQLKQELHLHHRQVNKYIVLHDTTTFAGALLPAVSEFITQNTQWIVLAQYLNNNGLLVLSKVSPTASPLPLIK